MHELLNRFLEKKGPEVGRELHDKLGSSKEQASSFLPAVLEKV